MAAKYAILGDGAWGTAIALHLAQNPDNRVCLWSAFEENAQILREKRENVRLLPGVPISQAVELTTDAREALSGADLGIVAIPTVYLRKAVQRMVGIWPQELPALSLAKGLENDTFERPTQILQEVLGIESVAVLSGPSHAEEVSRGKPTSVVIACSDEELAVKIQHIFTTDRFRTYTNLDVIGVELAGALKNVIGIAAGIGDGLSFGDNAKSALLTRGLVEMARFGVAMGAEHATFFGLAGLGDLITTCVSPHGRNRRVGERLGRGEKLADILSSTPMVAEGVYTARSVHFRSKAMGIDLPIMNEVYRVLYEDKPPLEAVFSLMVRQPKKE
ncbi:MAG TPA: NAD(P)H-dependent glycerol-3-phosphate dehydrogenase [Gemmataceae bacterium]|jgi:glycerol-3-phosphate dehydrogenase (NAD(P)+)|nr:NAD(P)H-dependent glycerol-3-phosphate dehydrogenase [Gemmataceae bacterium]